MPYTPADLDGERLLPLAELPIATLLGFAGLPHGIAAARRVLAGTGSTKHIIPAQRDTLLAFVLTALGLGIGWVVDGIAS